MFMIAIYMGRFTDIWTVAKIINVSGAAVLHVYWFATNIAAQYVWYTWAAIDPQ